MTRIALAVAVVLGTILAAGAVGNWVGDAVSEEAGGRASTITMVVVAVIALLVFVRRRWMPGRGANPPGA